MENKKISETMAQLMAINGDEVETYMCEWLSRLLKTITVKNFIDLVENKSVWLELAELGKFKSIALEAPYFSNRNLPNFVKLLDTIWQNEKGIHLFGYFKSYLAEIFNPDFVFVENFEACIYSHTQEIIHIILIATIVTCMMIFHTHYSEDNIEQLFDCMDEMDDDIRTPLKEEFKLIIELYDHIEEDFIDESLVKETSRSNTIVPNRARVLTTVTDQHIAKKVEELQGTMDNLQKENEELKSTNNQLTKEISDNKKIMEEQSFKINHLTYSRDDLLEKLKSKNFEMINEEIKDKQKEIDDLKETLANNEAKYKKRLREADESKDELIKKLHQMENYKSEFEILRRATESKKSEAKEIPSDEEVGKLNEQIMKLQQNILEEKQKCLNLEMQTSEMSIQNQRLKLENQDLNYRVKELENNRSLGASEIYVDDYDAIKDELSAAKYYKKLDAKSSIKNDDEETSNIIEHLDNDGKPKITPFNDKAEDNANEQGYSQRRVEQLFLDYEKKCLHRIKMILKESGEYKEKLSETLQEVDELKEYNEELEEKVSNLESRAVENIVLSSKELKDLIYNVKHTERDSSEIAQDLLKNIVKKDLEIARLRHNRKRQQKETINMEAIFTDKLSLIYEVIENYISNS